MRSVRAFFEKGAADRLMDPACHPPAIAVFLAEEERMLSAVATNVEALVEVGCVNGRYLEWALSRGKRYVGVDIVVRHIRSGQRAVQERRLPADKCQFVVGDAGQVSTLVGPALRRVGASRALLFFPFNSFGTMSAPARVLKSILVSRQPFLISSYQATPLATACRAAYYQRCGYRDLTVYQDERGVWFSSPEGLKSAAYDPRYLVNLCLAKGVKVTPVAWAQMNQAYATPALIDQWIAAEGSSPPLLATARYQDALRSSSGAHHSKETL